MDNILTDIIKIVVGYLLGIFSIPVKNWIHYTRTEQCAYEKTDTGNPQLKGIVVTTMFGKTSHINCYWFNKRKDSKVDGISYKHCIYGEKFHTTNGKGGAQCPFDRQYIQS